jgi:hypothetical protein
VTISTSPVAAGLSEAAGVEVAAAVLAAAALELPLELLADWPQAANSIASARVRTIKVRPFLKCRKMIPLCIGIGIGIDIVIDIDIDIDSHYQYSIEC